jgi:hypothetical protein
MLPCNLCRVSHFRSRLADMVCARQNVSDCQGVIAGIARPILASRDVCACIESKTSAVCIAGLLAEVQEVKASHDLFRIGD